jgi:hypothetical protein
MEEASRRYRLLLLPLGADDARAAVEDRLEADGYWRSRPGGGRIGRRSALVALGVAGALVFAGGGTALAVALTRSPHQATPPASTRTPPPVVSGTDVVETTVRTTAPVVAAKKPKAKAKPKVVVAAKSKPKAAKAKVKPKPKPKPKATTTVTAPTVLPSEQPKLEPAAKKPKPAPKTTTAPEPKAPAPKPKPTPPPAPPPDTTAPTVTITTGPGATTHTDSADFAFQANEANVSFTCRLDGADYTACSSPAHLGGLGAGSHTFFVRATDKAGNVGQPASVSWTYTPPDTTAPKVTITTGPSGATTDTSASFSFSADEAGSTFQCSLDGGGFSACESPAVYNGLAPGSHSFSVRATDKAGNTSAPATRSWTIEAPLPDLVVTSFSRFSITVTNQGKGKAGPSVLTITNVGTFSVPSLPPGGSATFSWSTCRVAMYVAVVDRTNAVAESNESNNTASLRNSCK